MILIGGASPTYQNGMGAFQEAPQVKLAEPYCKYAHAVEQVDRIPYYVEQAVRSAIYGRPGATYLDMPDDIIGGKIEEEDVVMKATVPAPPRTQAIPEDVDAAARRIRLSVTAVQKMREADEVREYADRADATPAQGFGSLADRLRDALKPPEK